MIPQPLITPHPEVIGDYLVLEDFTYEWTAEGQRQRLVIPEGFDFDLASVPRIFWTLTGITPDRLRWTAPLIHDFLYEYARQVLPAGSYQIWDKDFKVWVNSTLIWSKSNSDRMFCRLMREDGISWRKRRMAYRAVQIGGHIAWNT